MPVAEESVAEVALGMRLREARESRGLSLKAVETASDGSVRASMLGAYERGEHSNYRAKALPTCPSLWSSHR